jgi:hypothetical protein
MISRSVLRMSAVAVLYAMRVAPGERTRSPRAAGDGLPVIKR